MEHSPNTPLVDTGQPAPKLLLDTNVYVDLADGKLPAEEERLESIAAHRDPPLLWACEITLGELLIRLAEEEPSTYLRYRAALRWMDRLCGVFGMAPRTGWALRNAVFSSEVPDDGKDPKVLVQGRRAILRAETYDQVAANIRAGIDGLRAETRKRIDEWVEKRTRVNAAAREPVKPGERGATATELGAKVVLGVSRRVLEEEVPLRGPMRDEADQKRALREVIAFEASLLRKARNPQGYNHAKWRGDYYDYWLCTYPAAGYTIVTREKRLRDALKLGECVDPRVVNLDEGIAIAEDWLARRP
jgi:hypothetical protein